ncbi:MAG TPA: hypothetical protein VHX19_02080, partial [Stellaceae bacterium]|nr:hypothetical protein [Stellaceae bacterium]
MAAAVKMRFTEMNLKVIDNASKARARFFIRGSRGCALAEIYGSVKAAAAHKACPGIIALGGISGNWRRQARGP